MPAHKLSVTLGARIPDYDFEVGARATFAARSKSSVSASSSTAAPVPVPGFTVVDVFASWKPQDGALAGLDARFGIDNVFDADYRDNLSIDRGKGRNFKFSLTKQFGM